MSSAPPIVVGNCVAGMSARFALDRLEAMVPLAVEGRALRPHPVLRLHTLARSLSHSSAASRHPRSSCRHLTELVYRCARAQSCSSRTQPRRAFSTSCSASPTRTGGRARQHAAAVAEHYPSTHGSNTRVAGMLVLSGAVGVRCAAGCVRSTRLIPRACTRWSRLVPLPAARGCLAEYPTDRTLFPRAQRISYPRRSAHRQRMRGHHQRLVRAGTARLRALRPPDAAANRAHQTSTAGPTTRLLAQLSTAFPLTGAAKRLLRAFARQAPAPMYVCVSCSARSYLCISPRLSARLASRWPVGFPRWLPDRTAPRRARPTALVSRRAAADRT
jgi:hypothetical protein